MKAPDQIPDPFGEKETALIRRQFDLLGARFSFTSNHAGLMALADAAYRDLPVHRLGGRRTQLRVDLNVTAAPRAGSRLEPGRLQMLSGADCVGASVAGSSFALISAQRRAALVSVAPRMLRFPYHTRYEFIEFAVFTLAARVQGLISMHGACVGHRGRGVLLMGGSGSGKSTLTLLSVLSGLQFLSEDSVFVSPDSLLATAVPNYLHVQRDSLQWVDDAAAREQIRQSPVIRRRSGVRKYEVDARKVSYQLAPSALHIRALVFLSTKVAGSGARAQPLTRAEAYDRLQQEQAYAAAQPGWPAFRRAIGTVPVYELRRGQHPKESVATLMQIMA